MGDFILLKFITSDYKMNKNNPFQVKEKQIGQLLKLEELFHSRFMTEELLNEMVALYVRLGQTISKSIHPVKMYFMQKIKYVLSRPEINTMLEKHTTTNNNDNFQDAAKPAQNEDMIIKKLTEEAMEEIRQNHSNNTNKDRQYDNSFLGTQLKNKQRNMKIELQMRIMEQIESTRRKLTKDFQEVDQLREKKEQEMKKMFYKQEENLNQRLANRKKKKRRKSDDIKEEEKHREQIVPPPKEHLILVQKEMNQTYERFTRLTMNKTKRATQNANYKENEGRVKIKLEDKIVEEEEELFTETPTKKEQANTPQNQFKKVKNQDKEIIRATLRDQNAPRIEGTSIEYKTFDQTKGRVTIRMKQYQEIQDDEFLI